MGTDARACIMVIFGGTGDLTYRKLLPALYNLQAKNAMPDNFAVVAVGRRDIQADAYMDAAYKALQQFSRTEVDPKIWAQLCERLYYQKANFNDDGGYYDLKLFLSELDEKHGTGGNRVYYLAVAPEYFPVIVEKLYQNSMVKNRTTSQKVVIEKPFGRDLSSARALNQRITEVFSEENTYRIDHYLGKEMIQNIMVLRFANVVFESVWNSQFIDNIQISSSEIVGVENRGEYFEQSGALRDMVQNHMLQLLTLIAMEPPANLSTESIRDEKVKVLKALEHFTPQTAQEFIVRGQYGAGKIDGKKVRAYRAEEKVSLISNVETFVALKVNVANFRWAGVPFYIRTGKRMQNKGTEIIVQFKRLPQILYFKDYGTLHPNILSIKIQPTEGIYFQFNVKEPGIQNKIVPVNMDFCQNCLAEDNSPEAYQKLLLDVTQGDSTLFTRWDEVENAWKFVESIANAWQTQPTALPTYAAGTWGPLAAEQLLVKDQRQWWQV